MPKIVGNAFLRVFFILSLHVYGEYNNLGILSCDTLGKYFWIKTPVGVVAKFLGEEFWRGTKS